MKKLLYIILIASLSGCKQDSRAFIHQINGYWEIESVTLPNGSTKEYTFNGNIDFIQVNDSLRGYRKKLKPKLNGTFSSTDDMESLKLVLENDSLNAYYQTPFANWKETILFADESHLKVINQDKKVYLYKRFKPIVIE